jgi:HEPN domain-containing protein
MLVDDPGVIEAVRQWVEKAEGDLQAAAQLLKSRTKPVDIVCFHAQQCIEKYLKALLIWHGLDFPKSHNLTLLFERLPVKTRPEMSSEERLRMTDYATVTRYPGDYEPITLTEARHAVALARRAVRRSLPKPALAA